jgi:hypothetical protein
MKTPHNLRKWTLAAAMALVLGTFGAGVASADPNEGVGGGVGSDTGGGFNLGPIGGGAGSDTGGGLNLGPGGVSAGAGSNTGGGAQFWSAPR